MAKNKVSEWSATASNNTDVGGIDIAEGCAPSGINNGIRELMAQIKDMQAGTDGDNFTVGGNLSVTGTTTLTGALTVINLTTTGNTVLGDASTDTLTITSAPVSLPNGLNFDLNTLVIDSTNNRVGIGTATPTTALQVLGTVTATTFAGALTGNVTGNVTGNLTGNADTVTNGVYTTGTQTIGGSKTFSSAIIGNLTGNVTGNVTGNADTATTLSTTLAVAKGGTGATTSTGTGSVVLSTSPTLVTPALGTPSSVVLTNATGTANSLNAGIGVNQTWTDVTSSRALGTTYTNSTGKPILVSVFCSFSNGSSAQLTVGGVIAGYASFFTGGSNNIQAIVPNGATYSVSGTYASLNYWAELR